VRAARPRAQGACPGHRVYQPGVVPSDRLLKERLRGPVVAELLQPPRGGPGRRVQRCDALIVQARSSTRCADLSRAKVSRLLGNAACRAAWLVSHGESKSDFRPDPQL